MGAVAEECGALAAERADDILHLANLTAVDDIVLDVVPQRFPAPRMINGKEHSVFLDSRSHAIGVGQTGRQRFFTENGTHSGVDGVDNRLGVHAVGRGDGDDV